MLKANKSDKRRAPTGGHNIMVHVSPRRQLVLPFCRRLPFVSVVSSVVLVVVVAVYCRMKVRPNL